SGALEITMSNNVTPIDRSRITTATIAAGPFQGLRIPEAECRQTENGLFWHPAMRTPHVLEKFPPADGWAIEVNGEFTNIDLFKRGYKNDAGEWVSDATAYPTARFT